MTEREKKFQIEVDMDGTMLSNDAKLRVLDMDGNVVEEEPWFRAIDISLRPNEPIAFTAEMYADHLKSRATVTVGTLSSWTDSELIAEVERRRLDITPVRTGDVTVKVQVQDVEPLKTLLEDPEIAAKLAAIIGGQEHARGLVE